MLAVTGPSSVSTTPGVAVGCAVAVGVAVGRAGGAITHVVGGGLVGRTGVTLGRRAMVGSGSASATGAPAHAPSTVSRASIAARVQGLGIVGSP